MQGVGKKPALRVPCGQRASRSPTGHPQRAPQVAGKARTSCSSLSQRASGGAPRRRESIKHTTGSRPERTWREKKDPDIRVHQLQQLCSLCKLVGEISVHALVRVPRSSPNGAHSRAAARSRAEASPPSPVPATSAPDGSPNRARSASCEPISKNLCRGWVARRSGPPLLCSFRFPIPGGAHATCSDPPCRCEE